MRNNCFFATILVLFFLACRNTEKVPPRIAIKPSYAIGTGIVIVYDLSRSDTCLKPDEYTLAYYLMKYAFTGVCLTGIHILPDSRQQQPWLSPVIRADTLPLPDNFILAAKQAKRNKEAVLLAQAECDSVARMIADRLFLPQTYNQSDVAEALRLAAVTAQGYAAKGIHPVVIIVSDMLQDIQPGSAPEFIPAVDFPDGTEVIVIGASPSVPLKTILGKVKIRELPSFQHLTI